MQVAKPVPTEAAIVVQPVMLSQPQVQTVQPQMLPPPPVQMVQPQMLQHHQVNEH